jgi:uncharacterized YigZ family protein
MEEPLGNDAYLTLAQKSEGMYKDRGSKFLYFGIPVRSESEIKEELALLRKTYYDASHHCYAWILGPKGEFFRANDDGEPNHSAGDPILGQLRSNKLTNILIVVVRYFGGSKLGVSGLIQAYRTSASLAIEENELLQEYVHEEISLIFSYPLLNEVMKLVKKLDLEIASQQMELQCEMTLRFRAGLKLEVLAQLEVIEGLSILNG